VTLHKKLIQKGRQSPNFFTERLSQAVTDSYGVPETGGFLTMRPFFVILAHAMVGAIELLLHFPRQTCIFARAAQFGSCLRQAGVTFSP
jgi:hypothetical protein